MTLSVCLVSPLPPPYGGIAHWGDLITSYAKTQPGVELTVVDIAPRWRSIHDSGLLGRAIGGGLQMLRDVSRLLFALFDKKPGVIHLTTAGQLAVVRDMVVTFLARCFKIPFVYHIRFGRIPDISVRNTLEWRIMSFVACHAFVVVAIDEATGTALRKAVPTASVVVVPNCVDFSRLPVVQDRHGDLKTVLFVGWVIPAKGIVELLTAWDAIKPSGWTLKIVGPGKSEYITSLVQRFGENGVKFLGELPHMATMKAMAECDMFVLPSYTEGFPNAVVEAMAHGRAIIATDVCAIPQMLDGDCGVVIKPQDIEGLAAALRHLIKDQNLRVAMGERARSRALATFSIESVFATYVSVWRQAVEQSVKNAEMRR